MTARAMRIAAVPMGRPARRRWRSPTEVLVFLGLSAGLVWLLVRGATSLGYNWQWYRVPKYLYTLGDDGRLVAGPLLEGLVVTLELTAYSLVLTLVLGLATAILRRYGSLVGGAAARGYVELIRNTPLLIQIYLFYFILAPILGVDRFAAAVWALGVFEGAYAAEIFRAGIEAVPRGQWEASRSLGIGGMDCYRFVILPQAIQLVLPPMTGQAIALIKHSAIASVIAVQELAQASRLAVAESFLTFEVWFTAAAMYLVVTVSLSGVVTLLERRVKVWR